MKWQSPLDKASRHFSPSLERRRSDRGPVLLSMALIQRGKKFNERLCVTANEIAPVIRLVMDKISSRPCFTPRSVSSAISWKASPAGVSCAGDERRSTRTAPSQRSRLWIRRLNADCAEFRRSAAREKLRVSASARKSSKSFKSMVALPLGRHLLGHQERGFESRARPSLTGSRWPTQQ